MLNTVQPSVPSSDEFVLASKIVANNITETMLSVPDMHCGSCIGKIEKHLNDLPSVNEVRANLTKKQVRIQWNTNDSPQTILNTITELGFSASLLDAADNKSEPKTKSNLRALAVSGFAASNVMLLSVAVWSGADESTRQLFHWISAVITIPAIAYSARVFFYSAWKVVRVGSTNMDVPVSIGIILAVLLGLYDTINHFERVYFEAAIMLVFALLIGRTLETLMRERAAMAINGLQSLEPVGAHVVQKSGVHQYKATSLLQAGDLVVIYPGDRIPVDGVVESGCSLIDTSIVDGESGAKECRPGQVVYGGTKNISADIFVNVTATSVDSFLAKMQNLVLFAQREKNVYTQIADKAARWYAPVVHTAAVIAFILWITLSGDIHKSLTIAISVLIITCPCALALAVPMVHVIAGNRLLKQGVIMKSGSALEKLATIGVIVFDKTGTLTADTPEVMDATSDNDEHLKLAMCLAKGSEHPYAKAVYQYSHQRTTHNHLFLCDVLEYSGCGLEATYDGYTVRLGKRDWAASTGLQPASRSGMNQSEVVLTRNGEQLICFHIENTLRKGAVHAIKRLQARSLKLAIASGDQSQPVEDIAKRLQIVDFISNAKPAQKVSHVQSYAAAEPVLMVGDGINDCGAMAAAHVAMAPGTAANVGRNLADFIFVRDDLNAVPDTIRIAQIARILIRQNLTLAIGYNLIVLPLAFLGLVTPLIAAIAMSTSSILVVANATRLGWLDRNAAISSLQTRLGAEELT